MASRRAITVLTAGLVAGALAGCGSSYTKADFIHRADAICQSSFRQARAIAPPPATIAGAARLRGLAAYIDRVLPVVRSEADQLRGLRLPTQDRPLLQRYLAALGAALGDYTALARALHGGDAAGVTRAEAALTSSPTAALAKSYGLTSCGSAGATAA